MGVFEKAIIEGEAIKEIIPQREPFIFIDSFYGSLDDLFVCGYTPCSTTLFVENFKLTEPGVVENMAQSIAASSGWSYRERGERVPLGFIGAVSDFELTLLPDIDEEIYTYVRFKGEYGGIHLAEVESKQYDRLFAKALYKIFIDNGDRV